MTAVNIGKESLSNDLTKFNAIFKKNVYYGIKTYQDFTLSLENTVLEKNCSGDQIDPLSLFSVNQPNQIK